MRIPTEDEIKASDLIAIDVAQLKMLESAVYQRMTPRGSNFTPKKKKRKK